MPYVSINGDLQNSVPDPPSSLARQTAEALFLAARFPVTVATNTANSITSAVASYSPRQSAIDSYVNLLDPLIDLMELMLVSLDSTLPGDDHLKQIEQKLKDFIVGVAPYIKTLASKLDIIDFDGQSFNTIAGLYSCVQNIIDNHLTNLSESMHPYALFSLKLVKYILSKTQTRFSEDFWASPVSSDLSYFESTGKWVSGFFSSGDSKLADGYLGISLRKKLELFVDRIVVPLIIKIVPETKLPANFSQRLKHIIVCFSDLQPSSENHSSESSSDSLSINDILDLFIFIDNLDHKALRYFKELSLLDIESSSDQHDIQQENFFDLLNDLPVLSYGTRSKWIEFLIVIDSEIESKLNSLTQIDILKLNARLQVLKNIGPFIGNDQLLICKHSLVREIYELDSVRAVLSTVPSMVRGYAKPSLDSIMTQLMGINHEEILAFMISSVSKRFSDNVFIDTTEIETFVRTQIQSNVSDLEHAVSKGIHDVISAPPFPRKDAKKLGTTIMKSIIKEAPLTQKLYTQLHLEDDAGFLILDHLINVCGPKKLGFVILKIKKYELNHAIPTCLSIFKQTNSRAISLIDRLKELISKNIHYSKKLVLINLLLENSISTKLEQSDFDALVDLLIEYALSYNDRDSLSNLLEEELMLPKGSLKQLLTLVSEDIGDLRSFLDKPLSIFLSKIKKVFEGVKNIRLFIESRFPIDLGVNTQYLNAIINRLEHYDDRSITPRDFLKGFVYYQLMWIDLGTDELFESGLHLLLERGLSQPVVLSPTTTLESRINSLQQQLITVLLAKRSSRGFVAKKVEAELKKIFDSFRPQRISPLLIAALRRPLIDMIQLNTSSSA